MMTKDEAIDWIKNICAYLTSGNPIWRNEPIIEACNMAIKALSEDIPQWIPVKTRPMDAEERAYFEEHTGTEFNDEDAVMFDCEMPDDGQDILVTYKSGYVGTDTCDCDDFMGLEGNGDWDGIVAWMPYPKPWKEK